jgi:alkylhydroperoxidase/carboxymuconolactone decarboxylase family protein YurZ
VPIFIDRGAPASLKIWHIWERPGLSKRDRSLVTVSALIAMIRPDQLRAYVALARTNGVTEEGVAELITHNDVAEIGLVEATNM